MKCPHAQEFRKWVNMTPSEIRRWAADPRAKCYSFEATRRRLPALAKLRAKPAVQWTTRDCTYAKRVIAFNKRMYGGLLRDGCTDGYVISLRNWGYQPKQCKVSPDPKCPRRR